MLKGLPASWKSTWAKETIKNNPWKYKRVNKDDLRAMLDWWKRSKQNEEFVLRVRDFIITQALYDWKIAIVDDTNFEEKHEHAIRDILARTKEWGTVMIRYFDTDVEECIARDAARENPVWEKVIRDMHKKYFLEKKWDTPVQNDKLQKAYIFDVDWTLALMKDRWPYDRHRVLSDEPNIPVINTLKSLKASWFKIVIMSWRDWVCYEDTKKWLAYNGIEYDMFYMRASWDTRDDRIVKKEMFENVITAYYIVWVFDDRKKVVDMRRNIWILCFQVAEWNF